MRDLRQVLCGLCKLCKLLEEEALHTTHSHLELYILPPFLLPLLSSIGIRGDAAAGVGRKRSLAWCGQGPAVKMRLDVKVRQHRLPLYQNHVMRMPANVQLHLQRQLFARSERVKGIDFHPTEPWVCHALQ